METLDKPGMGDRIKQIRKKAGMRQWQLAAQLGTTQSAVHKYEHGVIPEPRRLIMLCRLGNTTIEWILTGQHWENGSSSQERPPAEVYLLAERLQSFGSQERRMLDEASRIMNEVLGALREPAWQVSEGTSTADKEQQILAAARRIHSAVLGSVLDQALERLKTPPPEAAPLPHAGPPAKRRQ